MRIRPVVAMLVSLPLLSSIPVPPAAFADEWTLDTLGTDADWWPGFTPPGLYGDCGNGLGGTITEAIGFGERLVVAGSFAWVNGVGSRGLAAWDGAAWTSLDPPDDLGGARCFAVHDGRLAVGGTSGSVWAWDGAAWDEIGTAAVPDSFSICAIETLGGDLWVLAAREVPVYRSATVLNRWTGSAWETIGSDTLRGFPDDIRDMHNHEGKMYIAGDFRVGILPDVCYGVARWGNFRWERLGLGVEEACALASYGGSLVVGGYFDYAGNVPANGVASWDGYDWHPLGAGLAYSNGLRGLVSGLVVAGDRLVAVGAFDASDTRTIRSVGAWDGAAWTGVGDFPAHHTVWDLPDVFSYWKGLVIVGGEFDFGHRGNIGALVGWDTSFWSEGPWEFLGDIRMHPTSPVEDFAVTSEGLVAAAEFFDPDRFASASGAALWNGDRWSWIGEPFEGVVLAVEKHRGRLYAGGQFLRSGDRAVSYIAAYDGTEWVPVGGGMDNVVHDLRSAGDRLVATGWFAKAGAETVWGIASWDGAEWNAMGNGLHTIDVYQPLDLEMYGGDVYACGLFMIAGDDRADGMARWNGATWFGMRGGNVTYDEYYPDMYDMAPWRGGLAVAGEFETAGGEPSPLMAFWNGVDWSALPSPDEGGVVKLGSYDGRLVAGGPMIFGAAAEDTSYVTLWDGERWSTLGSGLRRTPVYYDVRPVTALAEWQGSLYIGGEISLAGGAPAFGIARWDGATYAAPEASFHLVFGPNPARSRATIHWFQSAPGPVSLNVYDIRGRRAASLIGETYPGGYQAFEWGLKGDDGDGLPPGVYFVRLETDEGARSKKVVIVR